MGITHLVEVMEPKVSVMTEAAHEKRHKDTDNFLVTV
jgi:hypothetical protein